MLGEFGFTGVKPEVWVCAACRQLHFRLFADEMDRLARVRD